nr:uncharacterized protein LOC109191851 [Ipomoea batatas]
MNTDSEWSQNSSRSCSTSIPICQCSQPLQLRTSWTNDNPGRRFWVCTKDRGMSVGGCGFVSWYDPPMCSRSKSIIPGLLRRLNRNDEEIERLQSKLRATASRDKKSKLNCPCRVVMIWFLLSMMFVMWYYFKCTCGGSVKVVKRVPIA